MNTEQQPTETEIANLVERFYAKVRNDAEIGPVFNEAVEDWDEHLAILKDFWSTVLLTSGRYKGNPMRVHLRLPLEEKYFVRWLALFEETAIEVMPHAKEMVVRRANDIAGNMRRVLALKGDL